jgi:hypothetical protein
MFTLFTWIQTESVQMYCIVGENPPPPYSPFFPEAFQPTSLWSISSHGPPTNFKGTLSVCLSVCPVWQAVSQSVLSACHSVLSDSLSSDGLSVSQAVMLSQCLYNVSFFCQPVCLSVRQSVPYDCLWISFQSYYIFSSVYMVFIFICSSIASLQVSSPFRFTPSPFFLVLLIWKIWKHSNM